MIIKKNNVLHRKGKHPIIWDTFYTQDSKLKLLVIFCHGYKGFKDWGAWDIVAKQFAKEGCCFVKFNFSHNGGTIEQPIDFPDLNAFGENNYSKELEDLEDVLNFITTESTLKSIIDKEHLALIGHSRGGGIVTIKASEDPRITHLISWASVSNFEKRTATIGNLEEWKTDGVKYILNGRTKQKMPHYYQFYEDYLENKDRLNIKKATKKLSIPHLIIHGENDSSVSFSEAEDLHQWNPKSILLSIKNCDHVFNTKHPWERSELSKELKYLTQESIRFIKQKAKS